MAHEGTASCKRAATNSPLKGKNCKCVTIGRKNFWRCEGRTLKAAFKRRPKCRVGGSPKTKTVSKRGRTYKLPSKFLAKRLKRCGQ